MAMVAVQIKRMRGFSFKIVAFSRSDKLLEIAAFKDGFNLSDSQIFLGNSHAVIITPLNLQRAI